MTTGQGHEQEIVVVGVDGSEHSMDALKWACGYARSFGALLRPIAAWSYPPSADSVPLAGEEFEAIAKADLEDALRIVRTEFADLTIDPQIVYGPAAWALIEASKEADLLVVGTRGHGGFAGLMLGSVSTHCVHHAACPVVVVRHEGPAA